MEWDRELKSGWNGIIKHAVVKEICAYKRDAADVPRTGLLGSSSSATLVAPLIETTRHHRASNSAKPPPSAARHAFHAASRHASDTKTHLFPASNTSPAFHHPQTGQAQRARALQQASKMPAPYISVRCSLGGVLLGSALSAIRRPLLSSLTLIET